VSALRIIPKLRDDFIRLFRRASPLDLSPDLAMEQPHLLRNVFEGVGKIFI
jgi:hypothetical protein